MTKKRYPGDERKTKKQLIAELAGLRQQAAEAEAAEAEHNQAEEAVHESEERYRAIFEQAADSIVLIDAETGALVEFNDRAHENLGYTREEFQELTIPQFEVIESAEKVAKHLKRICREGADTFETRHRTKGGEIRDILVSSRAIPIGGRDFVQSIWYDITEHKQAEEALKLNVEHLTALIQASQALAASLELDHVLSEIVSLAGGVVVSDYTGIVLVDEAGHLSESAEDVPGVPAIEYRIRDEGLTKWILRSRQAAVVDVGEDGAMTPDLGEGAPRFANPPIVKAGIKSLAGLPLMVKDRPLGVLYLHSLRSGAFRDRLSLLTAFANQVAIAIEKARLYEEVRQELAERRRAEEEIRKLSQYLESVIDNANVWLNVLDENANVVIWNRAAEEISGYSREEVVGHDKIWEWLYPDEEYRNWLIAQVVAIIERGGMMEHFETTIRCEDGQARIISWNERGLVDAEGDSIGSIALGRDITERKRAQEQLRQQERLAAVGQLAGGIAHDFNNLLTSIMLYAQILRNKPHLPPDLMPATDNILGESRRAAQLVQQILDFSHRAMIETRPVDLISCTEGVVDILRRTIPENIRLLIEMGADECVVNADPTRIQQVVMNLATNARDAMPEGGELHIGLSRVEVRPGEKPPVARMDVGEWVCLAVSDTGMGMTEEVQSHLFEPFFTTKEVGKGTGLGLAQVHGIVKQHGGHIGVETEVGRGTMFRIYFPVRELGEAEEAPGEGSTPPEGKGETILLVEDEERLLEVGREILESLGYRVLTAADGREALEVYSSAEVVDLVVTDVVMPKMGGKYLLQELRKATPGVKGLAITGYATQGDLEALKEEGFLGVVRKPFDVETMAQAVRRTLDAD